MSEPKSEQMAVGPFSGQACRTSAFGVLLDRAKALRHEADGLEALARKIEGQGMGEDWEEALWNLACRR
jgi:hypothetical protein